MVKKKHLPHVSTLFIVIPMTLVMAFVGVMRTHGFNEGWMNKLLSTWFAMMPVAYLSAFIIIPKARKLAEKVARH